MKIIEPTDQGEELLNRLEQTGRVPSKDKFRRMACNVRIVMYLLCMAAFFTHRSL